jgi:hypothetical protein
LEKWSGKWDKGEAGGREGWVGPLIRMVSSDSYHYEHGKKGNPMREGPNKGIGKGVGSTKKNCTKNDRYYKNLGEERNPI